MALNKGSFIRDAKSKDQPAPMPKGKEKVEVQMVAIASVGDMNFGPTGGVKGDGVYIVSAATYQEIRRSCIIKQKQKKKGGGG